MRLKSSMSERLPVWTSLSRVRLRKVLGLLAKTYPDAHCELNYTNPYQLLIATILSAQCTDAAVNRVTPALFATYSNAKALAGAKLPTVEKFLRSIGLFRNKAKNIVGAAKALVAEHGGQVPQALEALVALPGVGRKTANVVRSNAFGLPGLAVDTHVLRVGQRLGFFVSADPVKVEAHLCKAIPPKKWGRTSHWLIWHGRRICGARQPQCEICPLRMFCPSSSNN